MAKCDYRILTSQTQDIKKNPLSPQSKLRFLRAFFPDAIIESTRTVFDACRFLASKGYEHAVLVVGEDRAETLDASIRPYVNHPDVTKSIGLKTLDFYTLARSDEDFSATMAREAAVANDLKRFQSIVPRGNDALTKQLFDEVRHGMGIRNG